MVRRAWLCRHSRLASDEHGCVAPRRYTDKNQGVARMSVDIPIERLRRSPERSAAVLADPCRRTAAIRGIRGKKPLPLPRRHRQADHLVSVVRAVRGKKTYTTIFR